MRQNRIDRRVDSENRVFTDRIQDSTMTPSFGQMLTMLRGDHVLVPAGLLCLLAGLAFAEPPPGTKASLFYYIGI